MKRQDAIKFHQSTALEISAEISKREKQLVELTMKQALGQVKNVREPKLLRQNIARLKSIARIKQLTNQEAK